MRWSGYKKISREVIEAYLVDDANAAVDFDSGASGELVASASISTGVQERGLEHDPEMTPEDAAWWEQHASIDSYVVVPHDPELAPDRLNAAFDLALALEAFSGGMSVEPTHSLAHDFAAPGGPDRDHISRLRQKERRARSMQSELLRTHVSGPEWGMFLSRYHLKRLPVKELRTSNAFARVEQLSDDLVFVAITNDPADSLAKDFDAKLDRARKALAPILMDPEIDPNDGDRFPDMKSWENYLEQQSALARS